MAEEPETVIIMRDQAIKLMSLAVMLRDDLIAFSDGYRSDVQAARALIQDVGEECALQLGGL